MKHHPKIMAIGLASTILFTACGVNATIPTADQIAAEVPEFLPIPMGEAPITTITSPQYPDAIRANVILHDKTSDITYNLADHADDDINMGDFTVYTGHDYELILQMHSDGNNIENIKVNAQLPDLLDDQSSIIVYFSASDGATSQQLMIARIFLVAYRGTFELQLSDAENPLFDTGISIESIDNTTTEVGFNFHVS